MASASDVPARYDLVISGGSLAAPVGFCLLDALEPSLPFRTHRAIYSYSPTFIERTNTSGAFGDNQQDFFLTSAQKDWSEGEQQRYARVNDADSARRYWRGTAVDVTEPGKVTMRDTTASVSFAGATTAIAGRPSTSIVYAASSTNLYKIDASKTITDLGAHGLGGAPNDMVVDVGGSVYMCNENFALIRKFDGISTFSTFSSTNCQQMAFMGNTLYGYAGVNNAGQFMRFDSAGTKTTIFTFKDATGNTVGTTAAMVPYGGKVALLLANGETNAPEVWIYDGSALSKVLALPGGTTAYSLAVVGGTIFISATNSRRVGGVTNYRQSIWYYSGGTIGRLWRADDYQTTEPFGPALCSFRDGLAFTDGLTGRIMFYSTDLGGVSGIGTYTPNSNFLPILASSDKFLLLSVDTTTAYFYGDNGTTTSSTVSTSLFDFDSSLKKILGGITVYFDLATDGNGGSVDLAYQKDSVDGAYSNIASGISSGAEYGTVLAGTFHSISVQVTLNKGTSTKGPVLKRIEVRTAPILTSYRSGEYVLDCTGDGGKSPRQLRDRTPNPLSGAEQIAQLVIAKGSTSPLTFTDRIGTYTGVIELLEAYEEHPGIDDPTRSGEFVVKLQARGI